MASSWGDWINLGIQAYSAYSGNKAAKDAGKQSQQGAQASNDLTWKMFEEDKKPSMYSRFPAITPMGIPPPTTLP